MNVPISSEVKAINPSSGAGPRSRPSSLHIPRLRVASATHQGLYRSDNQDFLYVDPLSEFMILADGMGGRAGGGVASRVATDAVRLHLEACRGKRIGDINAVLFEAYDAAFDAVISYAQKAPEYSRMGTTLVTAVWTQSGTLVVASIGDSRMYRLRGNTLLQMTRDHTLREELLSEGLITSYQARSAPRLDHILTRSVSARGKGRPEIVRSKVRMGDTFVMATDGLFGVVSDVRIGTILATAPREEKVCEMLIEAALAGGGPDNVTVIVSKFV